MTVKPLAGVRVLDLTAFPPGALATVMLADLGAEVIRVEPPALRGKPSLVIGQVAMSRGKRSITLDRRNPASGEVLKRLVAAADVVVESAKPRSKEALAFTYDHARAVNPRIVWCAFTGFGQDGPMADQGGHDLGFIAHGGLLAALSHDFPWHPAIMLAAQQGAASCVIGIQGALMERARTGQGAFVDVSLSEAATWMLTGGVNALSDKPIPVPVAADRRVYRCADGRYVAVTSSEPRTWSAFVDALGLPEALKETLHKPDPDGAITKQVADIFIQRPAAEWIERLATSGAAVHIVNNAKDLLDDPHIKARGSVVEVAGVPVPASPIRIIAADGAKSATATEAPHTVGQDTDDVLASAGFSPAEIAALKDAELI
jgi:crotonobetainyl-CoA:carnitine CoA-transferase CaiB-like acyl-CoA transferase